MSAPDLRRFRDGFSRFLRPGRVLLTGHSHQAWPDVVRDALTTCFDDAAEHVDDKWERAVFPRVQRVGSAILGRLGFPATDAIAFGKSSHELVFRLITALPGLASAAPAPGRNRGRVRIVTTTGEFHSLRRQLLRLEEEPGVEITWVPTAPRADLAQRLGAEVAKGADLLAVSAVFFEDAAILSGMGELAAAAVRAGTTVVVDAYHAFNVVPLDFGPAANALYVVAGGYKYAELGEGLCFMRVPSDATLRPVYTGWFSDFGSLDGAKGGVRYGSGGDRFAGATFDPTPFYRAEAALGHFDACGLDVPALRAVSSRQTSMVVDEVRRAGLEVVSPLDAAARGGFVSIRCARAASAQAALRTEGVYVDARGENLRIGPAPYLTDEELEQGTRSVIAAIQRAS